MSVLAIIPARAGSRGIPNKNFTPLAGVSPAQLALECGLTVGCDPIVFTTDQALIVPGIASRFIEPFVFLQRPPELAQDDTPMIAVVQHALEHIPGPPDQIIVLLQPTQVLRKPAHVTAAIELLRSSRADSVVSVVELPQNHNPELACFVGDGYVTPWLREWGFACSDYLPTWSDVAARRQDVKLPAHIRDGTVYAFWRNTVDTYGHLYGRDVRPLIIPASETCALDSPADWKEAERRFRELEV